MGYDRRVFMVPSSKNLEKLNETIRGIKNANIIKQPRNENINANPLREEKCPRYRCVSSIPSKGRSRSQLYANELKAVFIMTKPDTNEIIPKSPMIVTAVYEIVSSIWMSSLRV